MRVDFEEPALPGAEAATAQPLPGDRSRAGHGRFLRYRIDAISVAVVVATVGLQFTAYGMALPWYFVIPILFGVRQLHLVEHNHAHLKIFRQSFLNELLGWMCFVSNGFPLECYEMHHVHNHHRYTQRFDGEARDWSSPFGFGGTRYPDQPVGRLHYMVTFMALAWLHCLIEVLRRPGDALSRRFLRSAVICFGACAVMAYAQPWEFFLFFLIPWLVVYLGVASNNYDHHEHCKLTTPYDSSNVDLRFPYRGFGFNIGYHVAHHIKPTLHWSLLPRFHREVAHLIPPENFVVSPSSPRDAGDR